MRPDFSVSSWETCNVRDLRVRVYDSEPTGCRAWFKSGPFRVTLRSLGAAGPKPARSPARLRPPEALEPQQLQPVRVRPPRQELRGALAHARRPRAPREAPVIEEELQQGQRPL